MARLGPTSRRELIAALRRAGFSGPQVGARHQFMKKGVTRVTLPNPHGGDVSPGFLLRILREAGISREEWESL